MDGKSETKRAEVLVSDLKRSLFTYTLRYFLKSVKDADSSSISTSGRSAKSFNVIAATLYELYDEVLNFFVNRATNAFAESFNAKIKAFTQSSYLPEYIHCDRTRDCPPRPGKLLYQ